MDIIKMIEPKELVSFTENYNYQINGFLGQKLFAPEKTANLKLKYRQITEGADIPVMAQVHAFDTEARIGDRPTFKEIELEKLFIKEKLDQGESIHRYLNELGGNEKGIVDFVFNDSANLLSRVITRTEVANNELLYSGKITIDENNAKFEVDFGFDDANKIVLSGWSDANHDIIGDLEKVQEKANAKGFSIVRAITSSKVIGYMFKNTAIRAFWTGKTEPITKASMLSFVEANWGIEFIAQDAVYKVSARSTAQKRFYDENSITFLATKGSLGIGMFGITPEEEILRRTEKVEKSLCTLTMWEEQDPCTTWTKASGMYLPVMRDINKMIIAKVK